MDGIQQCDMRCGIPSLRNAEATIPILSPTAPSISPITIGSRPVNRQVKRAGKRDGFELHAYLYMKMITPTCFIKPYVENMESYASNGAIAIRSATIVE